MSRFTDVLLVSPLADGSTWVIMRDFGYDVGAEAIFLEAMGVLGVSGPVKYTLYWAVRLFGGLAWYRNAADRAAGFDRVLPDVHLRAVFRSERRGTLRRVAGHAWRLMRRP